MFQENVYVDCSSLRVGEHEHIDCSSGGEHEKPAGHSSPYASVLEKK